MSQESWIQVLTFSSGFVGLAATFLAALPSVPQDDKVIIAAGVTLVVGVIDLALGVFFKTQKPISMAYQQGVESQAAKP